MSNELDAFVATMLAEKQLPGIDKDEELKAQVQADLKKDLLQEIDRALVNALSDEKLAEFNALLDDPNTNAEVVQNFIKNSGVDINAVTIRTMVGFRALYLQNSPGVSGA